MNLIVSLRPLQPWRDPRSKEGFTGIFMVWPGTSSTFLGSGLPQGVAATP
jgi:hypothetical protein